MADQADEKPGARQAAVSIEASSLSDQLATIRLALKTSPVRRKLSWGAIGMVGVIIATSIGQVLLNRWNQPFYDALARRDLEGFLRQLMVFAAIAGGLLVLFVPVVLSIYKPQGMTRHGWRQELESRSRQGDR